MGSDAKPLHIALFPLMSPGHLLPVLDMALLFASRGVRATLITTPSHAATVRHALDRASAPALLSLHLVPFPPPSLTGLAPANEDLSTTPAAHLHTFVDALSHFEPHVTSLLHSLRPDCLLSDSLFPWTADLAASLSIPRISFHGPAAFFTFILEHLPHPLPETFTVPALPHTIHLHRNTLPPLLSNIPFLMRVAEAEPKNFGVIANTFRAAEPSYVDHLKSKKKFWCVGPVSLFNNTRLHAEDRMISWLDEQSEGTVVYVCFGSLCHFSKEQLREVALGLEASGRRFVWVVRQEAAEDEAAEGWMPEGFEERTAGTGVVVRGWCPQVAVLGHPAVGWFVTHCGWSSVLEALCAGVGMVTWPLFHEQFINRELVVEVMGAGVRMWEGGGRKELVRADEIEAVLKRVGGGGEEVETVRKKAAEYAAAAREAVEEGGSSYNDVTELLAELEAKRSPVPAVAL